MNEFCSRAVAQVPFVAAALQAGSSAQFIVAAKLRTKLVMATGSSRGVEPETRVLRFLPTRETREVSVNFVNQFRGQIHRTKWMRGRQAGSRSVKKDGRTNPFAAKSAAFARFWRQ